MSRGAAALITSRGIFLGAVIKRGPTPLLSMRRCPLNRARSLPSLFLALTFVFAPACDDDPGVEEVDRGAKPIEARVADGRWEPAHATPRLDVDDVLLLVTGTVQDTPFVMLATEDGAGVCAMAGEGPSLGWVDAEVLTEGRLERRVSRSPADGVDACAVLPKLAAR